MWIATAFLQQPQKSPSPTSTSSDDSDDLWLDKGNALHVLSLLLLLHSLYT